MKSWGNNVVEDRATGQARPGARMPLELSGRLHLITAHELEELRSALVHGRLPADLEAKLAKLAGGSLSDRYVAQNSRLIYELLLASLEGSFTAATRADRERLLRVLAYVRKDDDAFPDYLPGGFIDDQQEVRAAAAELSSLLQSFKAWRLRHQVPGMWRG